MEASDATDVIHFFFEEDSFVDSKESAEAKDGIRSTIYENLYDRPYKYGMKKTSGSGRGFSTGNFTSANGESREFDLEEESIPTPINPLEKSAKPYTPATSVDASSSKPFGNVLDAPIG
jgi:hypothetical protein